MSRQVLAFPVLPGKSDAEVARISEEFKACPRDYEESRRRLGITLERAYLQKTPMGSFVVAYVESDRPFAETSASMAGSDLDLDRFFVRTVKEVHGVDMSRPMEGPPPETIAEWFDSQVRTRGKGMAFVAPVIPEAVERARTVLREAFARPQFTASRRALNQNGEVAGLIITPAGPLGAAYLEGVDPHEGNRRFCASTDPFDLWFKEQLATIFVPAVDLSQPVEGVTEIFDSTTVASLEKKRDAA